MGERLQPASRGRRGAASSRRAARPRALTPSLLRSQDIRRAALFSLLCGAVAVAGEEIVVRVEARIDGNRIRYRCGGRDLPDLDRVEAWLKEQKTKAGDAMIRPVLGGAEDAITKAMKGLDERFWRAGLMPPELEVRLICVDVRKEAGQLVYRCGGRELTDATAVTKWLVEQQAKQDGARVHVLLRGGPAGWAHQVLWVRCAAANLFLLAETEEDRLPFVTPGEAPASGEVFRLKITDEGGLRGPEGETTLGEWGRVLEKAAKGIGSKGLVEHEVVVRVGTRTAWGQLELAFDVAAQAGYYRLFVECPEGDTWKRVPFRLPVTRMDYLGIALYVEAPRVRLPRDEVVPPLLTVLIRCTGGGTVASVGPPRRSLLPWFGDDKPPAPIDSPEFRTRVEGLRGIERRRDHLGIAVAIDAPPDLPATAVLKVVALFNDAAGLHVMTCTPVVSAGRAELEARTLPVPAAAPGQEMDEER